MTPADLWKRFLDLRKQCPIDDALLAELKAQKAWRSGKRTMQTARYKEWIALVKEFYAEHRAFMLENMVKLRPGQDPTEASSYDTDTPEMHRFLEFRRHVRMAPIHGIVTEEVADEYIWEILTKIIMKQCIRPDRCVEVPLPGGRRVPLSNRPEHLAQLTAHKDAVIAWFRKEITPQEYKDMFHLPGTKEEKQTNFGRAAPERLFTTLHQRMSVESEDSFNLFPDWLYMRGLKCPRVLVLSMVLHGISDIDEISLNYNRALFRRAGQKVDAEPPHIDRDARNVFLDEAAGGSKMGINPQSVEAIPGCSQKVWNFINLEYGPHFAKLGKKKAAKTNMPAGDDDSLGLGVLAATRFMMPARSAAIWDAETVHQKCPNGSKLWNVFGTYGVLGIPKKANPVSPAAAGECFRLGIMPECYPSGMDKGGEANSLRGRCGLQIYLYNYTDRVDEMLEHVIDKHPCADRVRVDADGNPYKHYIASKDETVNWYKALRMDPADRDRQNGIPLSNTGRAMLGMPHAPVHIQLPREVIVIDDSSDDEGGSCQPPSKRQCLGAE